MYFQISLLVAETNDVWVPGGVAIALEIQMKELVKELDNFSYRLLHGEIARCVFQICVLLSRECKQTPHEQRISEELVVDLPFHLRTNLAQVLLVFISERDKNAVQELPDGSLAAQCFVV